MDTVTLQPDKAQRTLWYITWLIVFIIGTPVMLLLLLAEPVVFVLPLILWLLIMVLILLWIPAYYRSVSYAIEDDAIRGESGVFWKRYVTVPFTKITNIDVTQGPLQRAFGIGTISVQTAGAGGNQAIRAELRLIGIRYLEGVKEKIRERIRTYSDGKVKQQPIEPAGKTKEPPVLEQILQELRAIRETLEKR